MRLKVDRSSEGTRRPLGLRGCDFVAAGSAIGEVLGWMGAGGLIELRVINPSPERSIGSLRPRSEHRQPQQARSIFRIFRKSDMSVSDASRCDRRPHPHLERNSGGGGEAFGRKEVTDRLLELLSKSQLVFVGSCRAVR